MALTALAMYERARRIIQTGLFILAAIVASAAVTWHIAGRIVQAPAGISPVLTGPVLQGWGSPIPFCFAVINGPTLMSFRDKYDVAIACGVPDPTLDKFEDKRITISPLFTIRPGPIEIKVTYSKEMAEAVRQQLKGVRIPQGTGLGLGITPATWYEVVLLPKGTDTSNIHRLSDVQRYGGKILSQG